MDFNYWWENNENLGEDTWHIHKENINRIWTAFPYLTPSSMKAMTLLDLTLLYIPGLGQDLNISGQYI